MRELADVKVRQVKEEAEKRVTEHMKLLERNYMKGQKRVSEQRELLQEKVLVDKKQRELNERLRKENIERLVIEETFTHRQKRKDEYKKLKKIAVRKEHDEKLRQFQQTRANLFSQG